MADEPFPYSGKYSRIPAGMKEIVFDISRKIYGEEVLFSFGGSKKIEQRILIWFPAIKINNFQDTRETRRPREVLIVLLILRSAFRGSLRK